MTLRSIIVMGVSGSGKSTVGTAIAKRLGYDFIDGDDLHTPTSIKKMSEGIALTDDDRAEWLRRINIQLLDASRRSSALVIAASLLKSQYRKVAVDGVDPRPLTVLLSIPLDESIQRLSTRQNHFMPPALAASQFEILDDSAEVDMTIDGTIPIDAIIDAIDNRLQG
ncbi:MAG: gluconokinase [Actinomycetota bacterium]|nr:gluconokinase [Actinomycetota bacterium]